jgi:hypothetical protein
MPGYADGVEPSVIAERRKHILSPVEWAHSAGTDFWAFFANADMAAAGSADLANNGWTVTAATIVVGSGADLLTSSGIGVTGGIALPTEADLIDSPSMFGDFAHGRMVQEFLGYLPTRLHLELYARFGASTNDETATGFGFVQDVGSPITTTDHLAYIFSDGVNFGLRSSGATDAGAVDDTDSHLWKITLSGTTAEWFIDGTSQGTIALLENQFPVSFGAGTKATDGANDPVISWVHIWYD